MKNIFLKELSKEKASYEVDGDSFHHFRNVLRGKENEPIKIFNGKGLVGKGVVSSLKKKVMTIECEEFQFFEKQKSLKLILGIPKKEYLESILRSCIQVGINDIDLVTTEFTPWKFKLYDRLHKILESSLIQSENPYLPTISIRDGLEEALSASNAGKVMAFMTEVKEGSSSKKDIDSFLIGPEGGFSESEIELIRSLQNISVMRCPTPIMKAETAVPYCAGLLS